MYKPYIELANGILKCLRERETQLPMAQHLKPRSDLDILFICHDWKTIVGDRGQEHKSYRKPDVVVITWRGIKDAHNWDEAKEWVTQSLDGNRELELNIVWGEVLTVNELKKSKLDEEAGSNLPNSKPDQSVPFAAPTAWGRSIHEVLPLALSQASSGRFEYSSEVRLG